MSLNLREGLLLKPFRAEEEREKASGNGRQRTGRGPFRDVGRKDPTPLSQGPL